MIFAVAGSGKTTFIVESLVKEKRSLIVTYTNSNYDNLSQKILKKFNGVWPETITLMTYFQFLYRFCYKPFLSDRVKARGIIYERNPDPRPTQQDKNYYISPGGYFYSNRLSLFLEKAKTIEDIRSRIETYFDEFIIDEIQDIAGRDFHLLEALMSTNVNMLFVGDFYQHTFDTSRDGNVNQSLFDDKATYYDSPFTDKVICGDCGGYYGHRVWHSNEPCRKHIWRCGDKYHHGTKCSTPKFEDHEMEKAFLMVANRLLAEKNNYIAKYQERFSPLIASTTELEAKLKALQTEYNEIIAEADQLLQANAAKGQDQEETRKHFDAMDVRIKAKKAEIEGIRTKIADTKARKKNIRIFLEALKGTSSLLYRFDTALWHRLVDYVTVTPEKTFVFHLRSGREMIIPLEEVH